MKPEQYKAGHLIMNSPTNGRWSDGLNSFGRKRTYKSLSADVGRLKRDFNLIPSLE